jgi:hypothetical protein
MVEAGGIEPPTSRLSTECSSPLSYASMELQTGIEPAFRSYEDRSLPLTYCSMVAGREGVEPPLTVLETAVLP